MHKRTRYIQVRVDKDEYMRIVNNARATGAPTYAAYVRDLALNKGFVIESKIIETNKLVHEILGLLKLSRCIPSSAVRAERSSGAGKWGCQSRRGQGASSERLLDQEP